MHLAELRRRIISRATTHLERHNGRRHPSEIAAGTLDQRLERWRGAVAQSNIEDFARRLSWDGLAPGTCNRLVIDVDIDDPGRLGTWARATGEIIDLFSLRHEPSFATFPSDYPGQPTIPFEHAFSPLYALSAERLEERVPDLYKTFSQQALDMLLRHLAQSIGTWSAPTLYHAFTTYRAARCTGLFRACVSDDSDTEYRAFVRHLLAGGMLEVFTAYPVLARLLATLVEQWTDHAAELLERLHADNQAISTVFNGGKPLGAVGTLLTGVSDRHHGGRSVTVIRFESGCCMLYKPRSLAVDAAFAALAEWLQARHALRLRVPRVINRDAYGWAEYIYYRPPASEQQREHFYEHAGMLLCLAHVLGATDLHAENVIATEEYPVLVDVETLLHPRAREIRPAGAPRVGRRRDDARIGDSVLATELLPLRDFSSAGLGLGLSGLGGPDSTGTAGTDMVRPLWVNTNQDAMTFRWQTVDPAELPHVDTLLPTCDLLRAHAEHVVGGFEQAYHGLLRNREDLLAPDGPLQAFESVPIRYVFRPTIVYAKRLAASADPKYMGDGTDWSTQFEVFARPVFREADPGPLWSLVSSELRALERLDIPLLVADTGRASLDLPGGGVVEEMFEASSYADLLDRVRGLSTEDLAVQASVIRAALAVAHPPRKPSLADTGERPYPCEALRGDLVDVASTIGEDLERRAVQLHGHLVWLGKPSDSDETSALGTTGRDLYDGSCGTALLFAALFRITGAPRWKALALRSVGWAHEREDGSAPDHPVGGATGLGSVIYALTRISQLTGESSLLTPAASYAGTLRTRIPGDTVYDVIGGSAGAILGLLALHGATGDGHILDIAVQAADHLLHERRTAPCGLRDWGQFEGVSNPGFAHGTAGIAYALLRLCEVTGDPVLLDTAREAIQLERVARADTAARADDLSPHQAAWLGSLSWCNGSAGIGLARLGGQNALDGAEIRDEIEACVRAVTLGRLGDVDSMCCGNAGQLELLLTAGVMQENAELVQTARMLGIEMVIRASEQKSFALGGGGRVPPGLFNGCAGVGYQLLRAAYPDMLPCVLLWK